MLDPDNENLLCWIATNSDTPPMSRLSAVSLAYRLGVLSAKETLANLKDIINDSRSKCAVQVKALELVDKVNDATGNEPELDEQAAEAARTNLLEKFIKCPN